MDSLEFIQRRQRTLEADFLDAISANQVSQFSKDFSAFASLVQVLHKQGSLPPQLIPSITSTDTVVPLARTDTVALLAHTALSLGEANDQHLTQTLEDVKRHLESRGFRPKQHKVGGRGPRRNGLLSFKANRPPTKPSLQERRQPSSLPTSKSKKSSKTATVPGQDSLKFRPCRDFFLANLADPYPNSLQKSEIIKGTDITIKSLNGWFTNIRRRSGWNDVSKEHAQGKKEVMISLVNQVLRPKPGQPFTFSEKARQDVLKVHKYIDELAREVYSDDFEEFMKNFKPMSPKELQDWNEKKREARKVKQDAKKSVKTEQCTVDERSRQWAQEQSNSITRATGAENLPIRSAEEKQARRARKLARQEARLAAGLPAKRLPSEKRKRSSEDGPDAQQKKRRCDNERPTFATPIAPTATVTPGLVTPHSLKRPLSSDSAADSSLPTPSTLPPQKRQRTISPQSTASIAVPQLPQVTAPAAPSTMTAPSPIMIQRSTSAKRKADSDLTTVDTTPNSAKRICSESNSPQASSPAQLSPFSPSVSMSSPDALSDDTFNQFMTDLASPAAQVPPPTPEHIHPALANDIPAFPDSAMEDLDLSWVMNVQDPSANLNLDAGIPTPPAALCSWPTSNEAPLLGDSQATSDLLHDYWTRAISQLSSPAVDNTPLSQDSPATNIGMSPAMDSIHSPLSSGPSPESTSPSSTISWSDTTAPSPQPIVASPDIFVTPPTNASSPASASSPPASGRAESPHAEEIRLLEEQRAAFAAEQARFAAAQAEHARQQIEIHRKMLIEWEAKAAQMEAQAAAVAANVAASVGSPTSPTTP